ncbi:MAG: Hsp20/alpha crystallin family protein [Clostridiales bacterium]|nr:Hsp20/alpha crystallin family protein [Clostridiales bacterium]
MFYPSLFNDNLFDDFMTIDFPRIPSMGNAERKLYGKQQAAIMKTDVRELEDHYEVDIDLPGFKKDEIKLELEKGNLTVSTARNVNEEEKNEEGKVIRQERYMGAMQRSFYVGDFITEEDIKAKFEDGVLKLNVPKKEAPKIPEKKSIMIEG